MSKQINFKHISSYEGPSDSPGYLLWRISTLWRSSIENKLKELGLTHPQFVVLATLEWLIQHGDTVNQITISRMVGIDPNTTSQILRGLEKKGLIVRKQTVDERSKNPILSTAGKETIIKAIPAVEKADKEYFDVLSNAQLNSLKSLFQKILLHHQEEI